MIEAAMHPLLEMVLSNALVATLLAVVAAVVSQVVRRPALTHALWLLVLLKLVTPPLVPVQLPWSLDNTSAEPPTGPAETSANRQQTVDAIEPAELALLGESFDELDAPPGEFAAPLEEKEAGESLPAARGFSMAWLVWLWPVGSLLWLGWTGWTVLRFHCLLRRAHPASAELQHQA